MTGRGWIAIGAISAGIAVICGAFAAHVLDKRLPEMYSGQTRIVAFESQAAWLPQAGRYAFVSAGTAALNGGGVALLAAVNAPFWLAWALTRAIVFATWSYPLQRDFVFNHQNDIPSEAPVASRP